jgi:hypothetical protein
MHIFLIVVFIVAGLLIAAVVAFAVWRYIATHRASEHLQLQLMNELEPVWKQIYAGRDPNPADVAKYASDPRTRVTLFDLLLFHRKLSLFPKEYRTPLLLAESQLVRWLMHDNELGSAPDKIEFMATAGPNVHSNWLVFRFRADPPHWAAKEGWMAGVVGPLPWNQKIDESDEDAFPSAPVVFSMFHAYDSMTAEQHVAACRTLVSRS